jgi:predicted XRE-type DNA-binding protein
MLMSDEADLTLTPSSGNVFADLGLPDPDLLMAKAEVASAIASIIRERGLTQTAAARELGVHQARISAITRGRLDDFSLERLLAIARRLGQDIEITIGRNSEPAHEGRLVARRRAGELAASDEGDRAGGVQFN